MDPVASEESAPQAPQGDETRPADERVENTMLDDAIHVPSRCRATDEESTHSTVRSSHREGSASPVEEEDASAASKAGSDEDEGEENEDDGPNTDTDVSSSVTGNEGKKRGQRRPRNAEDQPEGEEDDEDCEDEDEDDEDEDDDEEDDDEEGSLAHGEHPPGETDDLGAAGNNNVPFDWGSVDGGTECGRLERLFAFVHKHPHVCMHRPNNSTTTTTTSNNNTNNNNSAGGSSSINAAIADATKTSLANGPTGEGGVDEEDCFVRRNVRILLERRIQLVATLRAHRDFRDPAWVDRAVEEHRIDPHGTNFPASVWRKPAPEHPRAIHHTMYYDFAPPPIQRMSGPALEYLTPL